jgi:hypothetical protein
MTKFLLILLLAVAPLEVHAGLVGCADSNCNAGDSAGVTNNGTDSIVASPTSQASGFVSFVYFKVTGSTSANQMIGYTHADGSGILTEAELNTGGTTYPTYTPQLDTTGGSQAGSTFTMNTTSLWAVVLLQTNGSGEAGGARMWIEENSGSGWTERADITQATADAGCASSCALGIMGDGFNGGFSQPVQVIYAFVRKEWNGVDYNSATAQTNIEALLGCSVNPLDTDFLDVWPFFKRTSTTSETNLVTGGASLSFTSITRAVSRGWTGHGSGSSAECLTP